MKRLGFLLQPLAAVSVCVMMGVGNATAQALRSPEMNMQYHRAETAWRSGGSMLEAKARVDRVLRELPDDVEARKLRTEVLLALGRPKEALEDALRAAKLEPTDGEVQLLVSEAARMSNERELALKALDAAAEHVSEDATLHIRLSWNAVELGQLDRAEAFARIALALEPNQSAAYQQLARTFILQDKHQEAAEILARGLQASIIRPGVLQQDSVLARVATHPAIAPLLRP